MKKQGCGWWSLMDGRNPSEQCFAGCGAAGERPIPKIRFMDSLDAFHSFYINKYADHHAHEIAF